MAFIILLSLTGMGFIALMLFVSRPNFKTGDILIRTDHEFYNKPTRLKVIQVGETNYLIEHKNGIKYPYNIALIDRTYKKEKNHVE